MMTRNCFWLGCVLAALFLISCQPKRPAGILSKKQMVSALTEFYVKESRINALGVTPDSAAMLMSFYKIRYANEMNWADSAFDVSYQYYLNNPKQMSEIYDQVIDSLALREQKTDTPKAVE